MKEAFYFLTEHKVTKGEVEQTRMVKSWFLNRSEYE